MHIAYMYTKARKLFQLCIEFLYCILKQIEIQLLFFTIK